MITGLRTCIHEKKYLIGQNICHLNVKGNIHHYDCISLLFGGFELVRFNTLGLFDKLIYSGRILML